MVAYISEHLTEIILHDVTVYVPLVKSPVLLVSDLIKYVSFYTGLV